MERRSFLTLLASSPLLPSLASEGPIVAPPPPVVVPTLRQVVRMAVLPFGLERDFGNGFQIQPRSVARFAALPQAAFRPRRLMLRCVDERGKLEDVELLNLAHNGEPQLEDSVPSSVFSAGAMGVQLHFATASPGVQIVLAVLNPHAKPLTLNAAMIGDTLVDAPPEPDDESFNVFDDFDDDEDDEDDEDDLRELRDVFGPEEK